MKVFVYGTLRKGEVNASLLDGAICLGACTLQSGFRLFDLGDYPAAIISSGAPALVGEVYEITAETLQVLDALERYPDLYDRVPVMTPLGESWVYTYNGCLANIAPISNGDWCQTKHRAS
ncbi:gamma-glutamylcyclotransferase family protein [Photobacterium nomapromontoriensis]|uniref:gamma-glutamylcyclotransferase family protein n=1 Tax=Photobacterium nomapromontoriensis TaxID=2910237 RepID=UPI003D11F62A